MQHESSEMNVGIIRLDLTITSVFMFFETIDCIHYMGKHARLCIHMNVVDTSSERYNIPPNVQLVTRQLEIH